MVQRSKRIHKGVGKTMRTAFCGGGAEKAIDKTKKYIGVEKCR